MGYSFVMCSGPFQRGRLQPNQPHRRYWLVYDVDRELAALDWNDLVPRRQRSWPKIHKMGMLT